MMTSRVRAQLASAPPNGGRLRKFSVSFVAALLCLYTAAPARVFAQSAGKKAKEPARLLVSSAYPLVISEFRLSGPGADGHNNEYVEIFNTSDSPHTVASADGSAGYAVVASDGVARFVIPNNTVIPGRGHFLGVNAQRYSLSDYGGTGAAAGDTVPSPWTLDIPDTAGIALFNNATQANFTAANLIDAVGPTTAPAPYREGAGLAALPAAAAGLEYAVVRDLSAGLPRDTDDNTADFIVVEPTAPTSGSGRRLGAPGPEKLTSPVIRNSTIKASLIDANVSRGASPNTFYDPTPVTNGANGTLSIRRRWTNTTAANVTRLRFRIVNITTFPSPCTGPCDGSPDDTADLRALTSGSITVLTTDASVCAPSPAPCQVSVSGTTLEQPPAQINGGGLNSTLTATLGSALAPGASINLQFLLGVQHGGFYRFFVNVEALP